MVNARDWPSAVGLTVANENIRVVVHKSERVDAVSNFGRKV
jgi:hypothetical protein